MFIFVYMYYVYTFVCVRMYVCVLTQPLRLGLTRIRISPLGLPPPLGITLTHPLVSRL